MIDNANLFAPSFVIVDIVASLDAMVKNVLVAGFVALDFADVIIVVIFAGYVAILKFINVAQIIIDSIQVEQVVVSFAKSGTVFYIEIDRVVLENLAVTLDAVINTIVNGLSIYKKQRRFILSTRLYTSTKNANNHNSFVENKTHFNLKCCLDEKV
ncbi:MAG: hypothetical protein ACRCXK_05735 [Wohlfahrtiimonas sp.]